MADRSKIEFECPRCLSEVIAASENAGNRVDCPNCDYSLVVPTQSVDPSLFDDIFDSFEETNSAEPAPSTAEQLDVELNLAPTSDSTTEPEPDDSTVSQTASPTTPSAPFSIEELEYEDVLPDEHQTDDPIEGLESLIEEKIPLVAADPFAVDPDAAIKIDGIGDIFTHDDVYGVKCHVCDTRIHVKPSQAGTEVECPICYVKVHVAAPKKPKVDKNKWRQNERPKKSHIRTDDEEFLKKNNPPEELDAVEIDESIGFAPETEDLLAPRVAVDVEQVNEARVEEVGDGELTLEPLAPDDDDLLSGNPIEVMAVEIADDNAAPIQEEVDVFEYARDPLAPKEPPKPQPSRRPTEGKTRRELYQEAQARKLAEEKSKARGDVVVAIPKAGSSKSKSKSKPASTKSEKKQKDTFPEFGFVSLTSAVRKMIASPGLLTKAIIAGVLVAIGNTVMHSINNAYVEAHKETAATFGEWSTMALKWQLFGGVPFLIGTILLWYISGFVFRDAAYGKRQVKSFGTDGQSDFLSTFCLFSFGYFFAGLPVAFFSILIVPFRLLFSPPLLLSAWYNKSAFAIVAIDAFKNAAEDRKQWQAFYVYVIALTALSVIAGIFMMIPIFILSAICSLLGSAMFVLITIAYAAVAGWHCGLVVEGLEKGK